MLTLDQWNKTLPKPKNMETIRRWARNGQIWPPPIFDGHQYFVSEDAEKRVNTQPPKSPSTLLMRIKNGTKQKSHSPRSAFRNNGYYCYRDPRTGKEYGLGKIKRDAVNQAIEANIQLMDCPSNRLVDRISLDTSMLFYDWLQHYEKIFLQRGVKKHTINNHKSRMRIFKDFFPNKPISEFTTKDITHFISTYVNQGKSASAKLMRGSLLDIFKEAIADGHLKYNPVEASKPPKVEVKRSRLSLSDFWVIHSIAKSHSPWFCLSMEIALTTGQRISDISKMRWDDIENGRIKIIQKKTGAKLTIPLSISIANIVLLDTIENCRKQLSSNEFILSNSRGGKVAERTMTDCFTKARKKSGLTWEGTPPSFHEIRSLSARLYAEDKGNEFAQHLLGHKSAEMTALYRDSRGSEWDNITI